VEEDRDLMVKFPRVVRSLEARAVVRVACGGLHTAAITAAGEVYTWGCNDDGALGRLGDENFPAKVDGFGPKAACAVQLVGGDCHTAVVTVSGQVFTWGCYRDKEGKQWCDAATPKDSFKKKQVRLVPSLLSRSRRPKRWH
jgi:regulator of chromosome condensation